MKQEAVVQVRSKLVQKVLRKLQSTYKLVDKLMISQDPRKPICSLLGTNLRVKDKKPKLFTMLSLASLQLSVLQNALRRSELLPVFCQKYRQKIPHSAGGQPAH